MVVDNASEEMGCAIWGLMGPTPHGIAPLCPLGGLQMPLHLRIIAIYFVIQRMYQNLMLNILPQNFDVTTRPFFLKDKITSFKQSIQLYFHSAASGSPVFSRGGILEVKKVGVLKLGFLWGVHRAGVTRGRGTPTTHVCICKNHFSEPGSYADEL